MSELEETIAAIGQKHMGHAFTFDDALSHVKAVKVILAADGISDTEAWALDKALTNIGAPKELRDALAAFDPTGVALSSVLSGVPKGSRRARELIRAAIRVSAADGYSPQEREKVMEASWLLGIDPKVVYALEALVDLENRVRELGDPRLAERVVELSRELITPAS